QRLDGDADHVVVRLLRGQRGPRRLRVEPQRAGARVLRLEALLHRAGPEAPGGAELGDLLEEVVVDVEEEAEPAGEAVDVEAALDRRVDVGHAVAEGEGELLRRGRAGFADVIAADRDRIPFRNHLRAILEGIGDQPYRGR